MNELLFIKFSRATQLRYGFGLGLRIGIDFAHDSLMKVYNAGFG